jgi:DNA-directed RNA polymerase subunit RPC12/RpoP
MSFSSPPKFVPEPQQTSNSQLLTWILIFIQLSTVLKFRFGAPPLKRLISSYIMVDLTRPCDACGKMIGGGFKHCPKCQIYFCFLCSYELMVFQKKLPLICPMCGGKLMW